MLTLQFRDGEVFYVKFHFKTNQGIKNFTAEEAGKMAGSDPDWATRDLFNNINEGNFPSWNMYVQVMTPKEAETYRWNVLDVTKVWSHKDYPLIPVGKLTLNRNPDNYFADTEQSAFSPVHLIPGIEASEDKMLQGRLFSYADTHRHRLGGNYSQIPVNTAWNAPMGHYNIRDGFMAVDGNRGSAPNYEPNSLMNTPAQAPQYAQSPIKASGLSARFDVPLTDDDFRQPGDLYRKVMTETDRQHLVSNICGHLRNATRELQEKMVQIFARCDSDYGRRVAKGLGLPASLAAPSKL